MVRIESMKPNKIIAGKKFFVVEDLVKILGLTELTVRKYLQEKKIKSVKVGRRFYIEQKNLEAYLGGGRFFDQADDIIMSKINQAIKLTFESNVEWLAYRVKEIIIKDLTEIIQGNIKKVDQKNTRMTEFHDGDSAVMKERFKKTQKIRKDFEIAKKT